MSDGTSPALLETLLDRLTQREDLDLEFKLAKGGLPKSLWDTVSAFANTNGGWIVLGVDDSKDPPETVGVPNPSRLTTEFFNIVRNPNKISHPVCGALDVSTEKIGSLNLVVIRVSAAPRRHRPVYLNGNPYRGTFVRRREGDYRCTKPEIDRMMREASGISGDSTILPHFGWEDLDHDSFARYRRMYQTRNPASPWNGYDDDTFMRVLGASERNRESRVQGITVAGLLMFGTPVAIREWRSRHLIDYRLESNSASFDQRWDDRVAWEGNLFGAFEALYPRLISELPTPFQLDGATRSEHGLVQVALREALVNLLVHADYAESQASVILRSTEGYFFRNPGNSLVPESDLLSGHRSEPRNIALVRMFRHIGWAEEAGTGIAKIIDAWKMLGLRLPRINVGTDRYEFTLILRYAHLFSKEDRSWLMSLGESWAEAEQMALVCARHEGYVDNAVLRRLTGLHSADATKVFNCISRSRIVEVGGIWPRGALHIGGTHQRGPVETSRFGKDRLRKH